MFFSVVVKSSVIPNFGQLLYGTLVLSSLTFISAFDSITAVAFYAISTVVSKAIVYFECASIHAVASENLDATAEEE